MLHWGYGERQSTSDEGVKVEKRFGIYFFFYLVVIQTHICIVLLCYFVECVFTYILMETLGKVHRNIYKKKISYPLNGI